jgi:hypothetical protein
MAKNQIRPMLIFRRDESRRHFVYELRIPEIWLVHNKARKVRRRLAFWLLRIAWRVFRAKA